ncbi:excinuclease ABC subunit UvrC [Candidatus Kinetoplastidibacterium crithidiae]|uniref:UvrABC system protein C n=1 Tax=Candidatus Kinetoplastidibacterium crithidiae TCC036E TaxID=1208918 RepID=M1LP65_9PROT|nr:excinuclease ABC subunit UvrC [Candidatus Kinetoplastibacterium crithidii]AFZ82461.1 excinuclease ABC subunit C [Candidatus Kinetoplastibacterium crithidii (ex Angomonas deanei ATCC 30255)]AGF47472.1 excinuclease ABC subunit C uvrC [Candidatus Kinetoplastibacterium crithidii TCC036E]
MTSCFNFGAFSKSIPHLPGIYKYIDVEGNIIYVGKARDLKKRISSYFNKTLPSIRIEKMVSKIADIEIIVTKSEIEALILENNLIKSLKPKYNILFRDDKSYPYLKISLHEYPRLHIVRLKPIVDSKKLEGQYFGPFPDSYGARETIKILQKIFRLRTCEDSVFLHRSRPCLLGQIGKCSAPCTRNISFEDYDKNIKEASLFLNGKATAVLSDLKQKMQIASDSMNFELAATLRDQITALKSVLHKQAMEHIGVKDTDIISVVRESGKTCINVVMIRNGRHIGDKNFLIEVGEEEGIDSLLESFVTQYYSVRALPDVIVSSHRFSTLDNIDLISCQQSKKVSLSFKPRGLKSSWLGQSIENSKIFLAKHIDSQYLRKFRIKNLLYELGICVETYEQLYIECFDISHYSGESTNASCVVFNKCEMQPSRYKLYNIENIIPGDDYAAMGQVLYRRFSKFENRDMPNLVLIDGGPGQVEIAKKIFIQLGLDIKLIAGISKGEGRKVGLETLHFADKRPAISLGANSPALMLIAYIRDEAHRFAIEGVRNRVAKLRNMSLIMNVDGIGKKKSQALLKHFGSLQDISCATIEEIMSVDGISRSLAEKIYDFVRS